MKKLASAKTRTIFETGGEMRYRGQYRQIIVEARPLTAIVRLKGTRRSIVVGWDAIYYLAEKIEARAKLAEKLAAKKARRG